MQKSAEYPADSSTLASGYSVSSRLSHFVDTMLCSPGRVFFSIVLCYTFLTIIFTFPVAFSFHSVPGYGGDTNFYLWDLWWFKYASLHGISPYWTPLLFYPTGLSLAFSTITPFNGFLSVPLQFLFGLVYTYNLLWLSSFVIAGCGSFYLVRYLTGDMRSAFVAGLIFMFSPYHFAHALGHLSLISFGWIPLYVLYLYKTVREPGYRNGIIAAIFLIIIGLNDYTYLFYSVTFTVFLLLYMVITEQKLLQDRTAFRRLLSMFILFGMGFFPFVLPMLVELFLSTSNYQGFSGFSTYSADLLGFIIPSQLHPVLGTIVNPLYANFTGNIAEYTTYAGYTVLFLVLLTFLRIKNREIQFWLISAGIFFVLSLGPVLHANGIVSVTIDGMKYGIALPYMAIMKIPILSMARAPVRWDIMVMLAFSVLAGYGLKIIREKTEGSSHEKKVLPVLVTILLICLILFEFLSIPVAVTRVTIPDFYYSIAADNESYSMYEIPDFGYHLGFTDYMLYQTVHGKALLTGYTHIPEDAMKFSVITPFIKNLYLTYSDPDQLNTDGDIIIQNDTEVGPSILNYYNIRYIILHKNLMSSSQLNYAQSLLEESLGKKPVEYPADSLLVYRIEKGPLRTFMLLGENWYYLQNDGGTFVRWMANNGTILVYSEKAQNLTLTFKAQSFSHPRTLELFVNDIVSGKQRIMVDSSRISQTVSLEKGENIIRFHSIEAAEKPAPAPGAPQDNRMLSLGISNISLQK